MINLSIIIMYKFMFEKAAQKYINKKLIEENKTKLFAT